MKCILIICLFALVGTGYSQSDEGTRTIRFSLFSESDTAMGMSEQQNGASSIVPRVEFCYFEGNERTAVDVPASGYQGPFQASVINNRLRLYASSVQSLELVTPADVIADLEIPADWREVILYSFRSITGTAAQFLVLADASALQKSGHSFCVNLTGKPIAVNLGDQRFLLKQYGRDEFDLGKGTSAQLISIRVAAEWRETWKLALSTSRRLRKDDSYLFLFKGVPSNPRSMTLRLIKIPEFRLPAES
jgi:hypothetical protein